MSRPLPLLLILEEKRMPTEIDSLSISINAQAQKANSAIDALVGKIERLEGVLGKLDVSNLIPLANGVQRLGTAMQTMNGVKTADFSRLAKNLERLNSIDVSQLSNVSANVHRVTNAFNGLGAVSGNAQAIGEMAKNISKLGNKSVQTAITNIPQLATALKNLMVTLSQSPQISQNIIQMTNALANLASQGSRLQTVSNSLMPTVTKTNATIKSSKAGWGGLASTIGKVYATYWMLFRAVGKVKEAINISSQLTEVQNVVDVTFGKYSGLVDKMAETSITDYGMSELSVKQISSRFQAMGTAIGFSQGKMANMSIELTKLTGDMASFYDMSQTDVARNLQAIFTGETEPMRKYGVDLTNATLQEWANKKGIDAKIKSMSQAEKTMLRYQYVMEATGAAQGDFARTINSWHNQIVILKENFKELAKIVGNSFVNALKPLVKALNAAMGYVIAFAETVSNALGKIFGWKYEKGSSGMANDLETGAGAADDIASGMGDAADKAKKLKSYMLGIDELNVISPDDDSDSGKGGGAGAVGGGGSASAADGKWTKDDSLLDYESKLNNLLELGQYVGKTLTNALNSIPWDKVYEGARNFGTGLAQFLNGLISPDLFGAVGRTIAGALNTAIYAALSFGQTFDFKNLGLSIATGINEFFDTFDFAALAETINTWVQGVWDTLVETIGNIDWETVWDGVTDFISNIDLETIEIIIAAVTIKKILSLKLASTVLSAIGTSISQKIAQSIASTLGVQIASNAGIGTAVVTGLKVAFSSISGMGILDIGTVLTVGTLGEKIAYITTMLGGIAAAIGGAVLAVKNFFTMWENGFSWLNEALGVLGVAIAAVGAVILGAPALVAGVVAAIVAAIGTIAVVIHDNWDAICAWFSEASEWFNTQVITPIVNYFKSLCDNIALFFAELWGNIVGIWGIAYEWFTTNFIEPVANLFAEFSSRVSAIFEGLWIVVQALWALAAEWFNDTVVIPIANLFQSLKDKVANFFKLLWDSIKKIWAVVSGWFNTTVITPLANLFSVFKLNVENFFSSLWSNIQNVWSVASGWFADTVITPIQNAFETATNKIGELFNSLWNGIKTGVMAAMDTVIGVIESAINWVIDGINGVLEAFNNVVDWAADVIGADWDGVELVSHVKLGRLSDIPAYEIGGFPEDGLFFANHTELIGEFTNGKTAVANNDQIIAGIQQGVYQANSEQNSLLNEMIGLLEGILSKDTTITMNSREVGKSLSDTSRRQGYKLRTSY